MSPLWYPIPGKRSFVIGDAVTPLKTTFPITDTVGTGEDQSSAGDLLGLGTRRISGSRRPRQGGAALTSNPTRRRPRSLRAAEWVDAARQQGGRGDGADRQDMPGDVTDEPERAQGTTVPTLTISMKRAPPS